MVEFAAISGIIALWLAAVVAIFVLAMLPTIIAWKRKHVDLLWIFIANFGFGATGIGWIVTLVWALNSDWQIKKLLDRL